MSLYQFAQFCDEVERKAREEALAMGKSPEEAKKIGERERINQGSGVITALGRSAAGAMTGAAVGSVIPIVGTAVGGTIGFIAGAISAIADPEPSPTKAVKAYVSMFAGLFR
jgi:phage tail tape-measure protein